MQGFRPQLILGALCTLFIAWRPSWQSTYAIPLVLTSILAIHVINTILAVAQGAFLASVSDSRMGGTYLTLFNTLVIIGQRRPRVPTARNLNLS